MSINNNFYKSSLEIMKKLSIFITLIIVIGAIFYFWQATRVTHVPISLKNPQNWTVSFQFSESEITNTNLNNSDKKNLAEITKRISQRENWEYQYEDYGDMGILVTQIGDKKNGQDQKYWQYYVDDVQPQISADKYFPENGATVEWKFIESEF